MRTSDQVALLPNGLSPSVRGHAEPAGALASLGLPISRLGIGCSRFGSVTGATREEALAVLEVAASYGIDVVDTANIYGQGESETAIGAFEARVRRPFYTMTKVGQYYPGEGTGMVHSIKQVARSLIHVPGMATLIRRLRSGHLPKDFSRGHVLASVLSSLARLRREHVEVVFLHGPDLEALKSGEARDVLIALREQGMVGRIGVSCDCADIAEAVMCDAAYNAIQLPISIARRELVSVAHAARERGMLVVGREIFGGPRAPGRPPVPREVAVQTVRSLLAEACTDVLLIGTTNASRFETLVRDLSGADGTIGHAHVH